MENKTAKVSCFVRAYHHRHGEPRVFADGAAELLLGQKDYEAIGENIAQGIGFFTPEFTGTQEEAVAVIVEKQLASPVLGRSAFCEGHLANEIALGCGQYVIFAAGYDTFAYRGQMLELVVYHLDLPEVIRDRENCAEKVGLRSGSSCRDVSCNLTEETWTEKLLAAGFHQRKKTFGSLLGIIYYLPRAAFEKLVEQIAKLWPEGSAICLDYPQKDMGEISEKTWQLPAGAGEAMQTKYSYGEMEQLLAERGFLIYEHLDAREMTARFFRNKIKRTWATK